MAHINLSIPGEVINFTKMHGIGNDYIYIDCRESMPSRLPDLAREMSDRHFGVGGDGIVLICPPTTPEADVRMRMFNSDGSEARMCGNASRCIAAWLHARGLADSDTINLETPSGIKVLSLNKEGETLRSVTVNMGEPVLDVSLIPVACGTDCMVEADVEVGGRVFSVTAVSMGNPHGVIFTPPLSDADFFRYGPLLENHPIWPDRANIEFAQVTSPDHISVRVWERGTGETLACGTGACATAVAAMLTGRVSRKVNVSLRGGDLTVEWPEYPHAPVLMTGTATEVFTGTYLRNNEYRVK